MSSPGLIRWQGTRTRPGGGALYQPCGEGQRLPRCSVAHPQGAVSSTAHQDGLGPGQGSAGYWPALVTCSCPNGPVTSALPLFPLPVQMRKQAPRGGEADSGRSGSEPRPLLSRAYLGLWCSTWLAPGGGNVGSRRGCLMASLLGPCGCYFQGWREPTRVRVYCPSLPLSPLEAGVKEESFRTPMCRQPELSSLVGSARSQASGAGRPTTLPGPQLCCWGHRQARDSPLTARGLFWFVKLGTPVGDSAVHPRPAPTFPRGGGAGSRFSLPKSGRVLPRPGDTAGTGVAGPGPHHGGDGVQPWAPSCP